jgi:putative SOS response-associated peptidase YedK
MATIIITMDANRAVGGPHDQMPAILEQQNWPTWLGEVKVSPALL